MMKLCNDDKNLIKMINETTPKLYEKNNNLIFDINEYGLCHGLYGNLEILKEVEDSRSKYIYNKYFNSLLDIKWFEHSEYKMEAFMIGISGVAYSLMRLNNNLPSLLSLDIYK